MRNWILVNTFNFIGAGGFALWCRHMGFGYQDSVALYAILWFIITGHNLNHFVNYKHVR